LGVARAARTGAGRQLVSSKLKRRKRLAGNNNFFILLPP
jgi:hypothetical protein